MIGRVLGTTASGGAVAAALLAGWTGAVVLVCLVLIPTLAICWVLADPGRTKRLASLLTIWRQNCARK